ncbi:hypothetical protein I6A84_05995 [Frankia sp. CNm7]|uniref:Uncharacterized protein n=1 Tax=Frankia nepalensis TaxID=1836974 RepID=A0A937RNS2_9ACTN|nr:hypothetical protein [Frankia nepalensis]MBL7511292.1 hypothetical protein [Frankia nepalensis]MBL7517687.1 hypothetical protein [Frankia nepalensis]MBL7629858.1 hypothetical protein [Frankia nepalensis]
MNLLTGTPVLRGEQSRSLFLDRLSRLSGLRLEMPAYLPDRQWFLALVEMCGKSVTGLAQIPWAAGDLGVPAAAVDELCRLVDRWEAAAALADLPDDLLARLETELGGVPPGDVGHAYRQAVGDLPDTPPAHGDSAWAVLLHLAGRNAPAGGLPPYMPFLEAVRDRLRPDTATRVDEWNQRRAQTAELAAELDAARARRTLPAGPVHLIVQLERSQLHPGQTELTWWRQWPGIDGFEPCGTRLVPLDEDELERVTEELVLDLEDSLADGENTVALEFILPLDLLHLPVDQWRKEIDSVLPRSIGMQYPVVLRSLERQRTRPWHRVWRLRWRQLAKGMADTVHCGGGADEHDPDRLQARILAEESMVALVLSGPPNETPAVLQLRIALSCGLPVVAWHRGEQTRDDVADAIRAFLAAVDGVGLTDLRDRLRRLRLEARLAPARWPDLGRHLAVILDDPDRQPEQGPSIPAPVKRRHGR